MTERMYAKHYSETKTQKWESKFISSSLTYQKRVFNRARRRFEKALCQSFIIL